jgi:hypothetical protein
MKKIMSLSLSSQILFFTTHSYTHIHTLSSMSYASHLEPDTYCAQPHILTHTYTHLEQYDELSITSRARHCALPYYSVPKGKGGRFGAELSADDFVCYLRRYAARFNIDVRLSTKVRILNMHTHTNYVCVYMYIYMYIISH